MRDYFQIWTRWNDRKVTKADTSHFINAKKYLPWYKEAYYHQHISIDTQKKIKFQWKHEDQ